jgi:hypothetical protein
VDSAARNRIEKRAYELFLHRGAQPGYHFDDWIKAEKEVMAEIEKEKAGKKKFVAPQKKKW